MADPPPPKDAPPDVSAEHLEKMEDIIKTRVHKGNKIYTIRDALSKYRVENKLSALTRSGWIRKMMQKHMPDVPAKDAPPDVSAEHLEKIEDIIKTHVQKGKTFISIQNAIFRYRGKNGVTYTLRSAWIRKMMKKFEDEDLVKKMKGMKVDHKEEVKPMEQEMKAMEQEMKAMEQETEYLWEEEVKPMEKQIEMLEERNAALWELATENEEGEQITMVHKTIDGLISLRGEDFVKEYFAEEYEEYTLSKNLMDALLGDEEQDSSDDCS